MLKWPRQRGWGSSFEFGFWSLLAVATYCLTFQFDEPLQMYQLGAASWPRALIAALFVGALVQYFVSPRLQQATPVVTKLESFIRLAKVDLLNGVRLAVTFVIPLLYVFLLPRTGYYLTTIFFISGYMLFLGERRLIHLVGSSLLIYVISLLVFAKLFFVALPVGNWPVFYDFSNWLLVLIN